MSRRPPVGRDCGRAPPGCRAGRAHAVLDDEADGDEDGEAAHTSHHCPGKDGPVTAGAVEAGTIGIVGGGLLPVGLLDLAMNTQSDFLKVASWLNHDIKVHECTCRHLCECVCVCTCFIATIPVRNINRYFNNSTYSS